MPEGPEFRLGIHKKFAIKSCLPQKTKKITYKTVVVRKRWNLCLTLWYFLVVSIHQGYPTRGFMEFGSILVDTELSVSKLVTSQDSWNVKMFSLVSFFMWFTFVCWAHLNDTHSTCQMSWTPLFISWQNYVHGDFCGRCKDIRPGRQSLSYAEKLRWLQGWQGVLQRKDCLMM